MSGIDISQTRITEHGELAFYDRDGAQIAVLSRVTRQLVLTNRGKRLLRAEARESMPQATTRGIVPRLSGQPWEEQP